MCVSDLERRVAASEVKPHLCNWKERVELTQKLLTLLNSFTPPEVRQHTFGKSNAVCLLCLYTLHILVCHLHYYVVKYMICIDIYKYGFDLHLHRYSMSCLSYPSLTM